MSFLLTLYLFPNLVREKLIIIHDSLTFSTGYDVWNKSFILQNPFYYGLSQLQVVGPAQFLFMGIIYNIFSFLKLSFGNTTVLIYFFIQTYILIFAFFGFLGIYQLFKKDNEKISRYTILYIALITLLYFFNPFNTININNGIFFSLSYLSYGSIPLFLYYLLKLIHNKLTSKDSIFFLIHIFFIISITTYTIPVIIASLILISTNTKIIKWKNFILQSFVLVGFTILLTLPITIPFILQSLTPNFINSYLSNSTNSLIQRGILTPLIGIFHWPLYSLWTPRSLYTFATYYNGFIFALASISMYIIIIFLFIKNKNIRNNLLPYIVILLLAIFFAKGSNPPFGDVYTYLVNNISIFGAVRSPDNKFSVLIPVSFCIILLLNLIEFKKYKYYILGYIGVLILIFSYPFFTKEVILSKDDYPNSGSYVFNIIQEYTDVVNYVNNDRDLYKVLSLPESGGYRAYDINQKLFIGRDIIATLIRENPVYYDSLQDDLLKQFVETKDINLLHNTNIKYILIRKDIFDKEKDIDKMIGIVNSTDATQIIDNQYLTLYKVPDEIFTPKIVLPDNQEYSFTKTNITQYNISLKGIKDNTQLNFLEGFNKQYKLYLDNQNSNIQHYNDTQFKYATQRDINILFQKPLFEDTHKLVYDYANQWTIDPEYIKANFDKSMYKENLDGSIDLELTLYFKPQSYFYLGIIISGTTLILCLGYLGYVFYRKRGGKLSPHPEPRATLASEGQKGSEGQNTSTPALQAPPPPKVD